MPITEEGRLVAAAILVIEIEDVLLASMQPSGAAASICLKCLLSEGVVVELYY